MRRIYYIKPNIQHSFTGFYAFLTAVEIVLFGMFLLLIEHLNVGYPYDIQLYIRFSVVLLMILLFTGFNFWLGTRLSHRIVGPMIQIQRVLEQALKGKYKSRIQLRTNDYLHEIAEDLNRLFEKLEQQQQNQKESDEDKVQI